MTSVSPSGTAPPETSDGVGSLAGSVLKGRFVLKQPIGRGATGVVYRAYDRRPGLHPAQIAVKVLHEELQREQVTLARVRQDFAASQALEHPNIAKVFEFHRDERYCFYTMELLDGESLRRLIDLLGPEALALEEVSPLIRDMAAALAYAHRRDVVHGDFKPENVVVTRNLNAKVLDFGFARAALAVQRRLGTQAERQATVSAYASAEVLEGRDPEAIDDVYSFACVCYELLAGRLPFGALDALAARGAGLEPLRIERLSDAQWAALARALALRTRDRRISVGDLAARLCADARPPVITAPRLPARPEDTRRRASVTPRSRGRHEPARSRRPRRSHPWLAAALVAGIAIALGILYVAIEREAPIHAGTETMASRAREPAAPPIVDRPARADAEPAAPLTGASTKPTTSSPPSQRPDSPPAVASSEPAAGHAGTPAPTASPVAGRASAEAAAETADPVASHEAAPSAAGTAATATRFAFQAPRYAMSESKSLISIPVERKDGRGAATVVWWTVEGDAHAYDDYAYLGRRTESFADGETTRYIQIPVVSDHIAEGDEDFFVELASPGAVADAGTLTRTEVVIRDDD